MLGKEALLLAQGKKEPMLSIPNGWPYNFAFITFKTGSQPTLTDDYLDYTFPGRKVPISLLQEGAVISELRARNDDPQVKNVQIKHVATAYATGAEYYIADRTKDAEIRW